MTHINTQSMAQPYTKVSNVSLPKPECVLLDEQTMSSLFVNIVHVYRHHFRVIFFCCALPMLPLLLLLEFLKITEPTVQLLGLLLYYMGIFVISGVLTVVLSDICLGNRPTVRRSYARILSGNRWWNLFSTGLLYSLAMSLGLLLILPGLWLMVRGFFTSIIVALEGRRSGDAIRRSFALTKGQAWRIMGLLLPLFLLMIVPTIFQVIVVSELPAMAASVVTILVSFVLSTTLTPAIALTMVLLYYDQRVRREAYDAQALSEDLMR
jgi:hypothetical protein